MRQWYFWNNKKSWHITNAIKKVIHLRIANIAGKKLSRLHKNENILHYIKSKDQQMSGEASSQGSRIK